MRVTKRRKTESLLVLWVGKWAGAGFTVVRETSDHAIESRSAAFTPIPLRVVLTVLHAHAHTQPHTGWMLYL